MDREEILDVNSPPVVQEVEKVRYLSILNISFSSSKFRIESVQRRRAPSFVLGAPPRQSPTKRPAPRQTRGSPHSEARNCAASRMEMLFRPTVGQSPRL